MQEGKAYLFYVANLRYLLGSDVGLEHTNVKPVINIPDRYRPSYIVALWLAPTNLYSLRCVKDSTQREDCT